MNFSSSAQNKRKKNMNFELNLVPFIDVLSTCICFLLLTAVFVNLGSMPVNQAVGSEKVQDQKNQGSIVVSMGSQGDVRIEVKDVKGIASPQSTFKGLGGKIDYNQIENWVENFSQRHAEVKTVLLMPNPTTKYNDLIQLMGHFKKHSMEQIGVAPL